MKRLLIFLSVLAGAGCWGQEFTVYPSGLIYSDHSVGKLKHIVDSLNLKFKVCDANKVYYSFPQAKAHFIVLEKKRVKEAKADMERGMPFAEFMQKYPQARVTKDLMVVKNNYESYDGDKITAFNSPNYHEYGGYDVTFTNEDPSGKQSVKGKWLFNYDEKSQWSDESVSAFYFIEDLQRTALSKKYSRMVQYSECMVDTTATVFTADAKNSGLRYYDTTPNKISKFNDYVAKVLKQPQFSSEKWDLVYGFDTISYGDESHKKKLTAQQLSDRDKRVAAVEKEYNAFQFELKQWYDQRLGRIDSLKNADPNFMVMLKDAHLEAQSQHQSDDTFEEYVGLYISPADELALKRNRRVVGGCSQDQSPRIHALNIAVLSAETTKWEIFLRSHLDIMNDRFDRVSDGSYAYGARDTYIRELEVLDINVPDLIFGISLRVDNPATNHYFGSITRIGRALAESAHAKAIEADMLDMIADNSLDDYNRVIVYFLFDNYNHYLKDEQQKSNNADRLALAVNKMPSHIAAGINVKK